MTNEVLAFSVLAGLLIVIALVALASVKTLASRWRLAHDRRGAMTNMPAAEDATEHRLEPHGSDRLEDEIAALLRRDEVAGNTVESPAITYLRRILISELRKERAAKSAGQTREFRSQIEAS